MYRYFYFLLHHYCYVIALIIYTDNQTLVFFLRLGSGLKMIKLKYVVFLITIKTLY